MGQSEGESGVLRNAPETKEYPTLYIREGQALHWVLRYAAVAGEAKALDEIAQALQITWEKRW